MDQIQYLDFELVIEKSGEQYQARVVRSPVGEATHTFSMPFSPLELENFALRLGVSTRGKRRISSQQMDSAREFGGKLFGAVFGGDVRASFLSGQHEAKRSGHGLRFKLRLDAPELVNVPWEYLYDDSLGRFLSLFEDTPLVRYLDMRGSVVPLSIVPPLSVLVMLSTPSDFPALDVEREKTNLESALRGLEEAGMLTVTWMEKATLPALGDCLLRGCYHVFHFVGHGGFDEQTQDGVLVLEDEGGRGRLTSGERIAVLLGNHKALRLALLNACEGARTSADDPFAGTATSLVRTGAVPAVVAMQFPITDEAAITFARGFYTALTVGRPVDAAVTQARLAIFADDNDVEWGTPVLYMRSPDGRIFDVASLTPEMPAARLPQAEQEAAGHRARAKQQARLKALYEQATTLIGVKEWDGAQETLANLQKIDPDYRGLAALVEQVRSGVQEQKRFGALYHAAERDLEAGRLPEAIAGFQTVLALDPSRDDAARQLTEAQARLELQEKEERAQRDAQARLAELAHLFAVADAAAQAERWHEAIQSFEKVVRLDEGYRDAATRLVRARVALAREEADRRRQAALGERYDKACERMKAQDWPEAERLLREIRDEAPDYRDVAALLARVTSGREREERLNALSREAEEAYVRREWGRAADLYGQVLALKPGYRDSEARRAEAQRQQLAALYGQARAHLEARRWTEAIEAIQAIVDVEPGYSHPVHGTAAALMAQAQQGKEQAELPAVPARRPPKPSSPPEPIDVRNESIPGLGEGKDRSPASPTAKRPEPTDLPEEVKRRARPRDQPA